MCFVAKWSLKYTSVEYSQNNKAIILHVYIRSCCSLSHTQKIVQIYSRLYIIGVYSYDIYHVIMAWCLCVSGVFRSLQQSYSISSQDILLAMDYCEESLQEIDVTAFLQTLCGHMRVFRESGKAQRLGGGLKLLRRPATFCVGEVQEERAETCRWVHPVSNYKEKDGKCFWDVTNI